MKLSFSSIQMVFRAFPILCLGWFTIRITLLIPETPLSKGRKE
jgi:hypothetical protein